MADYFALGSVFPMTVSTGNAKVTINEVALTEGDFDGCWFSDRELRLNSGTDTLGWTMTTFRADVVMQKLVYDRRELSLKLCEYTDCDSVAFATYVIDPSASVELVKQNDSEAVHDIYNIHGVRQVRPQHGINLIRMKDGVIRKVYHE